MIRLALMFVLALPTPSWALSCMEGVRQTLPADGTTDAPINTSVAVLYDYQSPADLRWVDASGDAVPVTVEESSAGSSGVVVLTPDAPLAALESWSILVGDEVIAQFETGEGTDVEPPQTVGFLGVEPRHADFELSYVRGLFVELDGELSDGWHQLELTEADGAVRLFPLLQTSGTLVGDSGCAPGTVGLPSAEPLSLRVRAIDAAGNAGDWVVYGEDVTIPEIVDANTSAGCSTTNGAAWGWLALPALLGLRRRRSE